MTIVAANDPKRLQRRRAITLDIFTRHGLAWAAIGEVRRDWRIVPAVAVPPVPSASAADVKLLTRAQMPERFHVPPPAPDKELEALRVVLDEGLPSGMVAYMSKVNARLHLWQWLMCLRGLHDRTVPEGNPSGTDVQGWMSWAPFLSACVLYDPLADRLLEYADHDDHEAAQLPQLTFYQDGRAAIEAERTRASMVGKSGNLQDLLILHALGTLGMASTFMSSVMPAPPARSRGKPPLDELEAVQAAIWFRQGLTYLEIAERGQWEGDPESTEPRQRKNRAISRVNLGNNVLARREYSP